MKDIYNLTETQLKDKSTLEEIKEQAQEFIFHQDIREALELAGKIRRQLEKFPRFKDEAKELFVEYHNLITRLKIVSIPLLSYEEAAKLVQNNFIKALDDSDTDIEERIETRLMVLPEIIRDDLRKILYETLKESVEKIGKEKITIKGDDEFEQQYVKNWLLDYDKEIGIEKQSNIQRLNYLNQNHNAKNLSQKEKNKLHRLLHFYDEMKPITFPHARSKNIPLVSPKISVSKKTASKRKKSDKKDSKKKQEKKYQNIEAAPEKATRTMREDLRDIFKDK